jgi:hypothetical protein
MTMKTNPNLKWVTRTEMNRLMEIPEVREIIEAKFAELRLYFKDRLQEQKQEQKQEQDGWWEGASSTSNIIRLPLPHGTGGPEGDVNPKAPDKHENSRSDNGENLIKIVDSSRYRGEPEDEQVKIFLDYFKNHRVIRSAVLDEFFLRILPYSNIDIEIR